MANPIIIGTADDTHQYVGNLTVDKKLRLCQEIGFESAYGASLGLKKVDIAATTLSGATTNLGTTQIPDGAFVLGVLIRVVTVVTGATSIKIGDGSDDDKWGAGILVAAGSKNQSSDFTASPSLYTSATNVVLTAVGGAASFAGGTVRGAIFYFDCSGLTS